MPLFSLFRRKTRIINELDIDDVRRRVNGIREIEGAPQPSLTDLFALVGETEGPRRSFTEQPREPERVMPDQVPTTGSYQWER